MTRRLVIAAVLLLVASSAWAQRDGIGFGEALGGKVTKGAAPATSPAPAAAAFPFPVEIHRTEAGKVTATTGDLKVSKLPREIRAALGYLVRWGRGPSTVTTGDVSKHTPNPATPVIVAGRSHTLREVELVLPVTGLAVAPGGVKVSAMKVRVGGQEIAGAGFLEMKADPSGWLVVTRIEIN